MATIILGNGANLSVSDDNSNGDTVIVGNGADDTVSANYSSYDAITLGNGAGDSVSALGIRISQSRATLAGVIP